MGIPATSIVSRDYRAEILGKPFDGLVGQKQRDGRNGERRADDGSRPKSDWRHAEKTTPPQL